jgi:hypothetical protein
MRRWLVDQVLVAAAELESVVELATSRVRIASGLASCVHRIEGDGSILKRSQDEIRRLIALRDAAAQLAAEFAPAEVA